MAKVALITDTHHGAKQESELFADYQKRFYDEVFFKKIDELNIKHIIHCGDIFDKRKQVNFFIANRFREDFIRPVVEREIKAHMVAGNHDCFYVNSNHVNSITEIYEDRYEPFVQSIWEPSEIVIDGTKIILLPWICKENSEATFKLIKETKAQILFGHLELYGYEMYKGMPNNHGLSDKFFSKFEIVGSGHFHHKSSLNNINYLGSPFEITWADYDDPRGFHIFDTDTRELTYFENPFKLFHKVIYDDEKKTLEEVMDLDISNYKNATMKVKVKNKLQPHWFDAYIDSLESVADDVQIDENSLFLDPTEEDNDDNDEIQDVIEAMTEFVEGLEMKENKAPLIELLKATYIKALKDEN